MQLSPEGLQSLVIVLNLRSPLKQITKSDSRNCEYPIPVIFIYVTHLRYLLCRIRSFSKMMSHPSGRRWIYFGKEAGDHSAHSLFLVEEYVFWNSLLPNKMLRPSTDDNRVYAEYDWRSERQRSGI